MEVRLDGDTTEWDAESIFARGHKICTCVQLTQWQLFETSKPTESLEPVKKSVNYNRFTALDETMKWSSCCSIRYKIEHQYTINIYILYTFAPSGYAFLTACSSDSLHQVWWIRKEKILFFCAKHYKLCV